MRSRAPRSAAAALPLPPPPRGGREAEPQGAGREAWAGRTRSARLAAQGKGLREWGRRGADRKARRAGNSPTPGAADLLRGKSRSRVPGDSLSQPPRLATAPRPLILPPAGRAAAAAGRDLGRASGSREPQPRRCPLLRVFLLLLLALSALGVGHRTGRKVASRRVGARPRQEGRTGPRGSRAGQRGRRRDSSSLCGEGGGRPGLRAATPGSVLALGSRVVGLGTPARHAPLLCPGGGASS